MRIKVSGYVKKYVDIYMDILLNDGGCDFGFAGYIQENVMHKDDVLSKWDTYHSIGHNTDYIENCAARLYVMNTKSTLEEAENSLAAKFDGEFYDDKTLEGYSELTITHYNIHRCQIGEHDLVDIIRQYEGKYIIFVMEW